MNPNFHTNQLKDDFIEAIRARPGWDTERSYKKAIYEQTTADNCLLQWRYIFYMPFKYCKEIVSLGAGAGILYVSIPLAFEASDIQWALMAGGLALLLAWLLWGALSEAHLNYRFNEQHIAFYRHNNISEWRFVLLRWLAWGGVVVCLVAAIQLGPMAFVGAGGSALLAFKMVGVRRNDECYEIIPYDSILYMELIHDANLIRVCYKCQTFGYLTEDKESDLQGPKEIVDLTRINCEQLSADEVLSFIKQYVHDEVEISEAEDEKSMTSLIQKATEAGVTLRKVPL